MVNGHYRILELICSIAEAHYRLHGSLVLNITRQRKCHRKSRINKKWAKRYGTKTVSILSITPERIKEYNRNKNKSERAVVAVSVTLRPRDRQQILVATYPDGRHLVDLPEFKIEHYMSSAEISQLDCHLKMMQQELTDKLQVYFLEVFDDLPV